MPSIAFIGVRISCDMLERNSDLAFEAESAATRLLSKSTMSHCCVRVDQVLSRRNSIKSISRSDPTLSERSSTEFYNLFAYSSKLIIAGLRGDRVVLGRTCSNQK